MRFKAIEGGRETGWRTRRFGEGSNAMTVVAHAEYGRWSPRLTGKSWGYLRDDIAELTKAMTLCDEWCRKQNGEKQ